MIHSILSAPCILPLVYLMNHHPGPQDGAWGIAAAYGIGTTIDLGFGTYIFQKWRRIWHAA